MIASAGGERVIEAAQPDADDQHAPAGARRAAMSSMSRRAPSGDQRAAGAFDDDHVGARREPPVRGGDRARGRSPCPARCARRAARSAGANAYGLTSASGASTLPAAMQRVDVGVGRSPGVDARRDRLHADGAQSVGDQPAQQRRGDHGLADAGIGAGDEHAASASRFVRAKPRNPASRMHCRANELSPNALGASRRDEPRCHGIRLCAAMALWPRAAARSRPAGAGFGPTRDPHGCARSSRRRRRSRRARRPASVTTARAQHWLLAPISVPATASAHRAYTAGGHARRTLHVYVEHDGTPWSGSTAWPSGPDAATPLALELMAKDSAPRLLLGRPSLLRRPTIRRATRTSGRTSATRPRSWPAWSRHCARSRGASAPRGRARSATAAAAPIDVADGRAGARSHAAW